MTFFPLKKGNDLEEQEDEKEEEEEASRFVLTVIH